MSVSREQELAVLRSVVYASLFDYPLEPAQLEASLIGVAADLAAIDRWWRESDLLQATIEYRDGLYFPAGRSDLVRTRSRREGVSRELLDRDRRILSFVANMPFVRMVALSGSLAHLNAEGSADLDLFVISAPHRVWSVTVATVVRLGLHARLPGRPQGVRRRVPQAGHRQEVRRGPGGRRHEGSDHVGAGGAVTRNPARMGTAGR